MERPSYMNYSSFNYNKTSLAYNCYMYNTVFETESEVPLSGAYFGENITYEDGSYKLLNETIGYNSTRHYTCNSTKSDDTCEVVRYYTNETNYIELSGGIKIEDALTEMTSANDINKIDSNAKKELEFWYSKNLIKYGDKLEDATWCNDRSISDNGAYSINGSGNLTFKAHARSTIYLKCTKETDNFSLSNRNAKANHPIGLITVDETRLAGALVWVKNVNYYLYAMTEYWTISPSLFPISDSILCIYHVYLHGTLGHYYNHINFGLRPSISLNKNVLYVAGNGTKGNPYVIA